MKSLFLKTAFLIIALSSGISVAQDSSPPITPDNLDRLMLQSVVGHGQVCAVEWSPDGRWIAVQTSRALWLHDPVDFDAPPRLLQKVNTWCAGYEAGLGLEPILLFRSDGAQLVSSLSHTTTLWDISGEARLLKTVSHPQYIRRAVRFNRDGDVLLFGLKYDDPKLYRINLGAESDAEEALPVFDDLRSFLSVNQDASRILVQKDSEYFELVDLQEYVTLASFSITRTSAMRWSMDGRRLAVPVGEEMIILDATKGEEMVRIAEPEGAVAWSDDGALLLGRSGIVWDVMSGRAKWQHDDFWMDSTAQVKFSADNSRLFAYFPYPHVTIWEFGKAPETPQFPDLYYDENCCAWVKPTFSPDGQQVVLVDDEGRLARIDTASGKVQVSFLYINAGGRIVISTDGSKLAFRLHVRRYDGRGNETLLPGPHIMIWDIEGDQPINILEAVRVFDFRTSEDHLLFLTDSLYGISAPENHQIEIIDIFSGEVIGQKAYTLENVLMLIPKPDDWWLSVFFLPGYHALSSDRTVFLAGRWIYDAGTEAELTELQAHELPITNAAFSADGKFLITGSYDGTARLWDAETFTEVRVWEFYDPLWDEMERIYTSVYVKVDFSPDGKLAVIEDGLYDPLSGDQISDIGGFFSADGTRLARDLGGMIEIWSIGE